MNACTKKKDPKVINNKWKMTQLDCDIHSGGHGPGLRVKWKMGLCEVAALGEEERAKEVNGESRGLHA